MSTARPNAALVGVIFFVLGFAGVTGAVWGIQFLWVAYKHGGLW